MAVTDLRDVTLYLAPGFVALKIFQLFGAQRKRSQWEWTTWSVLAAALIGLATTQPSLGIVFGAVLGAFASAAWRAATGSSGKLSQWLTRELSNSAWDLVLEHASASKANLDIAIAGSAPPLRYYGVLADFGMEQYEAEPWIHLTSVKRKSGETEWETLEGPEGVMLHKERIQRSSHSTVTSSHTSSLHHSMIPSSLS